MSTPAPVAPPRAAGDLGVSPHHERQLVDLLRFWRLQRASRLRAVTTCFEELQRTRLNDATYTKDEVVRLLDDLSQVVHAETECELLNASHTCMLLVRQLCGQADQWHLRLQVDLNELQSKELLDAVGAYEKHHVDAMAASRNRPQITVLKTLAPVVAPPADAELHSEMERLRADNVRLQQKFESAERAVAQQSDRLKDLNTARKESLAEENKPVDQSAEEAAAWQGRMSQLQSALTDAQSQKMAQEAALHEQLTGAHKQLLSVKAQLEMTETELEKKFSKTNAYKNMKQMLMSKNKLVKELRARLKQHEPDTQDVVDDD